MNAGIVSPFIFYALSGLLSPVHQLGQLHALAVRRCPVEYHRQIGDGVVYASREPAWSRCFFVSKKPATTTPHCIKSAGAILPISASVSAGAVMRGSTLRSA